MLHSCINVIKFRPKYIFLLAYAVSVGETRRNGIRVVCFVASRYFTKHW